MLRAMKPHLPLSRILHPASPEWSGRANVAATGLSHFWRDWLFDEGSLTARLSALKPGAFRVECQSEGYGIPTQTERRGLHLQGSDRVWFREVILYLGDCPLVYARTAVPLSSLTGPARRLQHLGNRSLGSYLFRQPSLQRSPLHVSHCSLNSLGLKWCRRSVFRVHNRALMVSEAFSNELTRFI